MLKEYYVYILTNKPGGTLYIGITNNLFRRVQEHQAGTFDSFTKKYRLHKLVYYETYQTSLEAVQREKNLKEWHRAWKIRLIKTLNPDWENLSRREIFWKHGPQPPPGRRKIPLSAGFFYHIVILRLQGFS